MTTDEYVLADLNEAIDAWRGRLRRLEAQRRSHEAVEVRSHLRFLELERQRITMRVRTDVNRRRVR